MRFLRAHFLNVLTGMLTVAASFVVWTRFHPQRAPKPQPIVPTRVSDWRAYSLFGDRMGPANGRIVITVFSDYQCPFCRSLAADLAAMRTQWPQDLVVVYRHFPLSFHAHAREAAAAAICASSDGKFATLHDVLFHEQDALGDNSWGKFALMAGIKDTAGFRTCMAAPSTRAVITRDSVDGARLGVHGTPTFLLNEYRFTGSPGIDTLRAFVSRELSRSPRGG